jgi:hypothetical protein
MRSLGWGGGGLRNTLSGHAAIAVNGHEHNMQRLRHQRHHRTHQRRGRKEPVRTQRKRPRLAFANDETYGALRLELQPGSARYTFIALGGRVLDSGTIKCRSDPPETGLTAFSRG